MDADAALQTVRDLSAQFAETAMANLDAPIDHLDGWTVRDLVGHLGAVYVYATVNAQAASTDPTRPGPEAQAPEGDAVTDWFAERSSTLIAALESEPLDQQTWTHAGMQPASWWRRRMAHETAIHLWDAQAAAGSAQPIDGDLATDGIDEFFDVSRDVNAAQSRHTYPAESLHLHRSDGAGEWMIQRGASETALAVTHEHGKGDAAVRGPASELLLWIWGRPVSDIEIFGDEAVAAAWQALAP